ncbi:MAG: PadR family transcriptional regulator [Glaciihabitans sp.]|jgi:DNA-binding PadR family transcriptional regulator|nr:PadR family transcriptional regulator [Glaciihabitans sp.]
MTRIPEDHLQHHHHHHDSFDAGFGDRSLPRDFARRSPGFGHGPGGHGFGGDFGRGFGPRGGGRAGRGDIRAAILSLLGEAPSNGYGLIKAIAEKTNGAWRPSPGSVYPTLQQLVDEELITTTGEGRRTEFELTDAGKAYLVEHETEMKQAWAATPGRSEADAAFHESVGKLMGVVHQFRIGTTDAQRTAAVEKLDEARRALYLILAD